MSLRKLGPLSVLAVPLLALGLACGNDDIATNDDSAINAANPIDERRQFEAEAEARLDDIDMRIQELEDARGMEQQGGGNARVDLDAELDDLKQRREKLDDKLQDMRDMGDRDWDEARDDVEDELTRILDGLNGM